MWVLVSPEAKPSYGTKTIHALCNLLQRGDSPPLSLHSLDRFASDLMDRYLSVPRMPVHYELRPLLNQVVSENKGIMQAGLTTLQALISLMDMPLEERLDALHALDDYACSLTDVDFREKLSPMNLAQDLGYVIDKYKNCTQPGMLTLLTLYGVLMMPRDGPIDMQQRVLHTLEVQSCTLVSSIHDELNRYAGASSGEGPSFIEYK